MTTITTASPRLSFASKHMPSDKRFLKASKRSNTDGSTNYEEVSTKPLGLGIHLLSDTALVSPSHERCSGHMYSCKTPARKKMPAHLSPKPSTRDITQHNLSRSTTTDILSCYQNEMAPPLAGNGSLYLFPRSSQYSSGTMPCLEGPLPMLNNIIDPLSDPFYVKTPVKSAVETPESLFEISSRDGIHSYPTQSSGLMKKLTCPPVFRPSQRRYRSAALPLQQQISPCRPPSDIQQAYFRRPKRTSHHPPTLPPPPPCPSLSASPITEDQSSLFSPLTPRLGAKSTPNLAANITSPPMIRDNSPPFFNTSAFALDGNPTSVRVPRKPVPLQLRSSTALGPLPCQPEPSLQTRPRVSTGGVKTPVQSSFPSNSYQMGSPDSATGSTPSSVRSLDPLLWCENICRPTPPLPPFTITSTALGITSPTSFHHPGHSELGRGTYEKKSSVSGDSAIAGLCDVDPEHDHDLEPIFVSVWESDDEDEDWTSCFMGLRYWASSLWRKIK